MTAKGLGAGTHRKSDNYEGLYVLALRRQMDLGAFINGVILSRGNAQMTLAEGELPKS